MMQWRLKFSNLLCFVWVFRVISLMISERQQKMISSSSTKYVKHLLYSKLPRQTDQCLHGKHYNILHTRLPEWSGVSLPTVCPVILPLSTPTPTQLNYYFPGFCPNLHLTSHWTERRHSVLIEYCLSALCLGSAELRRSDWWGDEDCLHLKCIALYLSPLTLHHPSIPPSHPS